MHYQLSICCINPALDVINRRLLVAELVLLVDFSNLLLQALCFFFTDIRDEVEACLAEHVCPILWHANLCPFLDGALWHLLLWLHLWEEQYLLDEGLACHQHDQAVDTDTDTRCWRHTVLEGTEEV